MKTQKEILQQIYEINCKMKLIGKRDVIKRERLKERILTLEWVLKKED